jgi:hypothetical protein
MKIPITKNIFSEENHPWNSSLGWFNIFCSLNNIKLNVKSVQGYSSIVVNNVRAAANHFIVVVVYKNKFADPTVLPDFYIIPSDKISGLLENYNGQMRLLKGSIVSYQDKWMPLQV